ncbi:hypothetical protein BKA70DRAFT_1450637 [Coprinopsis sp. MPI-PUGE-AT-0042]|nr:hypothetical protein BKA70DRAFT_1450637 [Coprinopsis sp. MPI-PUGE-AT-0042]
MLKIPSLHWTTRTEAHETPEYLVLTQDILQVHAYWEVNDITGREEHENPDAYDDFLLPTQWSVTDQGTAVTFVRIRHPRKHTLRWFFANEDASLQVYTEDVEVELV